MGFFVLLGFVVYVVLAMFIINAIEKYSGSKIAKYVAIAVLVLIPTWDIVPGQLYFQHLCKEEVGIKVLKAVEVERTYFKANGEPDEEKLSNRFKSSMKVDRKFSGIFNITKIESSIRDNESGELLATAVDLRYHGGWLFANLLPQGESTVCPSYPVHAQKWKEAMKQKPDPLQGGN